MDSSKKQQGFGIVEVLVIALLVALLIFGGWYVWKNQAKPDTSAQTTSNSPQPENKDSKTYFELPELGVKFELNEELQNEQLVYAYEVSDSYLGASNRGGQPVEAKSAFISTKEIKDATASLPENCHAGKPGTLAEITRYPGTHASTHGNIDDHDHFKAVYSFDGFHLLANGSENELYDQDICWANISTDVRNKAARLEVLLLDAFKTVQPL